MSWRVVVKFCSYDGSEPNMEAASSEPAFRRSECKRSDVRSTVRGRGGIDSSWSELQRVIGEQSVRTYGSSSQRRCPRLAICVGSSALACLCKSETRPSRGRSSSRVKPNVPRAKRSPNGAHSILSGAGKRQTVCAESTEPASRGPNPLLSGGGSRDVMPRRPFLVPVRLGFIAWLRCPPQRPPQRQVSDDLLSVMTSSANEGGGANPSLRGELAAHKAKVRPSLKSPAGWSDTGDRTSRTMAAAQRVDHSVAGPTLVGLRLDVSEGRALHLRPARRHTGVDLQMATSPDGKQPWFRLFAERLDIEVDFKLPRLPHDEEDAMSACARTPVVRIRCAVGAIRLHAAVRGAGHDARRHPHAGRRRRAPRRRA